MPISSSNGAYVSIPEACLLPRANAASGSMVNAARQAGLLVPALPVDPIQPSMFFDAKSIHPFKSVTCGATPFHSFMSGNVMQGGPL